MKLFSCLHNGRPTVGALDTDEERMIDLTAQGGPADILSLIEGGPEAWSRTRGLAEQADCERIPLSRVSLLAPIPVPRRNIFCIGMNYSRHAEEFRKSGYDSSLASAYGVPEHPVIFSKVPSAVIGPGVPIVSANDPTGSTDYEGELAVIIGHGGRGIARGQALSHVFGYTIVNDVTSRDLQKRHAQWLLGKGIDSFCPMGPVIVTTDAMGEIGAQRLRTFVNDELRQDAPLSDLIFDVPAIIETISSVITLQPGDIIATGTPAGVGIGFTPPRFLKSGDTVSITIDGIGRLTNPVV